MIAHMVEKCHSSFNSPLFIAEFTIKDRNKSITTVLRYW